MNRKFLLALVWFPSALLLLIMLLVNLSLLHTAELAQYKKAQDSAQERVRLSIAASGGTAQVLGARVDAGDARSLVIQNFMRENFHGEKKSDTSPLLPYAETIVQKADEYGIDYRLVPAIATCESSLGKHVPDRSCHNAWGIAVYTGQIDGACFSNWPKAIDWVSNYISEKYYKNGISDLKTIGSIWAPPSVDTGYSWSSCVQSFMETMR